MLSGDALELSEQARQAIRSGSIKIRVMRSGMLQQLTFTVRKTAIGNITYTELYTERMVDTSELLRVATDIGLPISAANAHAFPKGKGASDFQDIAL